VWTRWLLAIVVAPLDDVVHSHWRAGSAEAVGILLGSTANAAMV
jgi:hypothetical protein